MWSGIRLVGRALRSAVGMAALASNVIEVKMV